MSHFHTILIRPYTDIDTCKIVFSKEAPMQLSDKFHNIPWKNLITAVAIPLAVGGLSAWITMDGMKAFEAVNQPPLTPPMWLSRWCGASCSSSWESPLTSLSCKKVRTQKPSPCMLYSLSLIFSGPSGSSTWDGISSPFCGWSLYGS